MADSDVVVVAVARTPFGRFEGVLKDISGPELGAQAIDAVVARGNLMPEAIEAVYGGVGMIASAMLTPVRQAVLRSKLLETTPSAAIDRACCSGMTAIGMAWKDILAGQAGLLLAGGFESLSRTPLLWARQRDRRIGDVTVEDPLVIRGAVVDQPISVYSGAEAVRRGVDRQQQDEWAVLSHHRYAAAEAQGYFNFERFAVEASDGKGGTNTISVDQSPRPDTNIERLAKLPTVYGGPTVTAGNAPGLNDGAAFLALARRDVAKAHGLEPLARIVDYVQVCGTATSGTSTPATAIFKLGVRNRIIATGWDLIEINEAYAATPLVSTLVLADNDIAQATALRMRTNAHGGAVAIGHPLGASGARIVMTLINGLRRRGGGRGVAAICGGFGQGDGVMVEV
jgi:acetyl-CoA C-acetyltransferase